jgi:hypothetical protein
MTTIKISAAHRDALYDQILDRLSGIGDVWLAVSAKDYEAATRLGREYSDDLRLLLDDLGWGDGPGRSIALSAPPDVLRRVFSRLRETAASQRLSEEPAWAEVREFEDRNRLVTEACETVLGELDAEAAT